MSIVALLDLATFRPGEGHVPEPVAVLAAADDDEVWDAETADETPEDLEAMLAKARDEL